VHRKRLQGFNIEWVFSILAHTCTHRHAYTKRTLTHVHNHAHGENMHIHTLIFNTYTSEHAHTHACMHAHEHTRTRAHTRFTQQLLLFSLALTRRMAIGTLCETMRT
jgi:hypothetical protein